MTAALGERGGELRPALDRVRAFARFDLNELGDDVITLASREPGDGGALRVDPKTPAALLARRDPEVGDPAVST